MSVLDINLNETVMVRLTPYAIALMTENHFKLFNGARFAPPFVAPEKDADGWSRMQLWNLMNEFGDAMYFGNPNSCFEGGVLRFVIQKGDLK